MVETQVNENERFELTMVLRDKKGRPLVNPDGTVQKKYIKRWGKYRFVDVANEFEKNGGIVCTAEN